MPTCRKTYKKKKYNRRTIAKLYDKPEFKFTTNPMALTFGSVGSAWTELPMNVMVQGLTGVTRIGRKIAVTSVEIDAIYTGGQIGGAVDDKYNVMRIVLAQWESNNVTPLATTTATLDTPINRNNFRCQNMVRKYLDKYVTMVPNMVDPDGTGYLPNLYRFKYYKRFSKPIVTEFADDGITYPDKVLSLSMISDSVAVVNPGFINGYWRMTYLDN